MEKHLYAQGLQYIAGVDEVGRGAWAGPLVAAAVIMPRQRLRGIRDSKMLSARQRDTLFPRIIKRALSWSIVSISQAEIDVLGLQTANVFALSYALTHLDITPDVALVDGFIVNHYIPTVRVTKGDQKSYTIAAASILAKVVRDHMMGWADRVDGRYQFTRHKGYGTQIHQHCLQEFGPSRWHRMSFAPLHLLQTKA